MPNGCNEPQKGAASADIIASTSNGRPDENHPESSSSSSERIQEDRRDIQDVSSPSASHGKNPAIEVPVTSEG